MSKELFNKFDQAIRPYYVTLTRSGICDNAALQQFLDRYSADDKVVDFLLAADSELNALHGMLDANEQKVLGLYLKTRFFHDSLATPLGQKVLASLNGNDILGLCAQLKELTGLNVSQNEIALELVGLTDILSRIVAAKSAALLQQAGINCSYTLPVAKNATCIDLLPDGVMPRLLKANQTHGYQQYLVLTQNPRQTQALLMERYGQGLPRFKLFKGILSQTEGAHVYFDHQGNRYVNRIPVGTTQNDSYISCTIGSLLRATKAQVMRLGLNAETVHLLTTNETGRYLKKNEVNLLAVASFKHERALNTLNYDFKALWPDCADLAKVITFMRSLKKEFKLQLQYEPIYYNVLQLNCAPVSKLSITGATESAGLVITPASAALK